MRQFYCPLLTEVVTALLIRSTVKKEGGARVSALCKGDLIKCRKGAKILAGRTTNLAPSNPASDVEP